MAILEQLRDNYFRIKERQHLRVWHRVIGFWVFLFFVWGMYRLLSPLPVWVEEVFVKGLVFGAPVFYLVLIREKNPLSSIGIHMQSFYQSVYLGLALGAFFWVFGQVANYLRYKDILSIAEIQPTSQEFGAFLLLALVTSWWEELVFSGYILNRLASLMKEEWKALTITASLFALLYIPAMIFRGTTLPQMFLQLLLLLGLSFGNGILMLRTRNLIAPVLSHAFWGVTVYLLV